MKSILVIAISSLSLSGLSFTTEPAAEVKTSTTVKKALPVQEIFGYFRTHRQGNGVSVSWGVTSTTNVSGFIVEWSDTGDFFTAVDEQLRTGSLKYSWKHENVFAGYNFYRIGCVMEDGTVYYSAVNTVRIVKHG